MIRSTHLALAILLLLPMHSTGCSRSQEKTETPDRSSADDPRPSPDPESVEPKVDLSGLHATYRGEEIQFADAYAWSYGGRAIEFKLTYEHATCASATEQVAIFDSRDFRGTLFPVLSADGHTSWKVGSRRDASRQDGVEVLSEELGVGQVVRFEVDYTAADGSHALKGEVEAISCGLVPPRYDSVSLAGKDEVPPPSPQPIRVQAAGLDIPINSALIYPDGEGRWKVSLGSAPAPCLPSYRGDARYTIILDDAPPTAYFYFAFGDVYREMLQGSPLRGLPATVHGELREQQEVEISLDGAVEIGGIPHEFRGKFSPTWCPLGR